MLLRGLSWLVGAWCPDCRAWSVLVGPHLWVRCGWLVPGWLLPAAWLVCRCHLVLSSAPPHASGLAVW